MTHLTHPNTESCAKVNTIEYLGVKKSRKNIWRCTFSKCRRWYLCITGFIQLAAFENIARLHYLISQWIFLLGRNGKLCITVSKQSRLEISFSSKPQEFNPYCLIPSKYHHKYQATAWLVGVLQKIIRFASNTHCDMEVTSLYILLLSKKMVELFVVQNLLNLQHQKYSLR